MYRPGQRSRTPLKGSVRSRRRPRLLNLEALEDRCLLSGNDWLGGPPNLAVWSPGDGWAVVQDQRFSDGLHVTGARIQAAAGEEFTGRVARITGADDTATTASFTAAIDWGDDQTSDGTIAVNAAGGFDVNGTHTYAQAGVYPVTVTVANDAGTVVGTVLARARVEPPPPTVRARGTLLSGTAGTELSGVVATFTAADAAAVAEDFTAAIDWGDGTTADGTVAADPEGGFTVTGTHTYAAGNGRGLGLFGHQFFAVTVTIQDTTADATATARSLARIAPTPPDLTARGHNIEAASGAEFSATVATFTDKNIEAKASDFTATIDWGDGTTSDGTITANDAGGFDVSGTHTYATDGSRLWFDLGKRFFVVKVTIRATESEDQATAHSLAHVAPAPPDLAVTVQNITATAGLEFSGILATFTDVDPAATVDMFTATIRWGDGTTSDGSITANDAGGFDVSGTHTYLDGEDPDPTLQSLLPELADRKYRLTVTVDNTTTNDSTTARGVATVTSEPASVQASGSPINAVVDQEFTGTVATFTAEDSAAVASGFTASIDWGDGTTSDGSIAADPEGGFTVTGSHTYTTSDASEEDEEYHHFPHHGPGSGLAGEAFLVTVTITDTTTEDTAAAVSLAHVAATPPTIVVTGQDVNATAGTEFTGVVATFTDSEGGDASDFSATIRWGDGSKSEGAITANDAGGFDVSGTHTYLAGGEFPLLVSIQDEDGDAAVNFGTATVAGDPTSDGTPDQRFIGQLYLKLLGRAVDEAGLAFFTWLLDQGGSSRADVVMRIQASREFRRHAIHGLYRTLLHRAADEPGLDYFVSRLEEGETLEGAQAEIVGSAEYLQARCGGTTTGFLETVYQDLLQREMDDSGASYFSQAVAQGVSRTQVADLIFGSAEFRRGQIESLYPRFLNRNADAGGIAYFMQAAQQGALRDDLVAAVLSSEEYLAQV